MHVPVNLELKIYLVSSQATLPVLFGYPYTSTMRVEMEELLLNTNSNYCRLAKKLGFLHRDQHKHMKK